MDLELRAAVDEPRRHVDVSTGERRRHFDVGGGEVRADVRLIAEGVTLSERVDRVASNLREETLRARRELSAMRRFAYVELDRKIQSPLEARISELGQRYADLESRPDRLEAGR